jgi:DNA polymerase I-like protein with 3'-5' exonuclease and polymerase domains
MSYNAEINMPIQGTASRIVTNAYNRISEAAYKANNPDFAPKLLIHDDLSFMLREEDVELAVPWISNKMIHTPYDFVNVPLSVECEIGPNLGEMKKLAKIRSDKKGIEWT